MAKKSPTLDVVDRMAREGLTLAADSQSSAILRAALARPPDKPAAAASMVSAATAGTGSEKSSKPATDK